VGKIRFLVLAFSAHSCEILQAKIDFHKIAKQVLKKENISARRKLS